MAEQKNLSTNKKEWLVSIIIILIVSFFRAFTMNTFVLPHNFAPGGVTGIAAIVETLTGFSSAYTMFILNVPILIIAIFYLGKKFCLRTILVITFTSIFLQIMKVANFYQYSPDNNAIPILASIASGALTGFSLGFLIKISSSTGGSDVVGLIIQKKNSNFKVSWLIFAIDIAVVLSSGIFYFAFSDMTTTIILDKVMFSLISLFISATGVQFVLNGFNSSFKFEIVTTKPKEISEAICKKLNRGATLLNSHGAFTGTENSILVCVIRRRQISELKKIIKNIDNSAFAFSTATVEVLGRGFSSGS